MKISKQIINIITPCSRPQNLYTIALSINIPRYRWIVVFDSESIPADIPSECEPYAFKMYKSRFGNAQRNYALNLINNGYIYLNDDDTSIHPDLWKNIKDLDNDFISFMQASDNGDIKLKGDVINRGEVDSHNFIFHYSLLGETRFNIKKYSADWIFANEICKKSKSYFYVPKILSVYNLLRKQTPIEKSVYDAHKKNKKYRFLFPAPRKK